MLRRRKQCGLFMLGMEIDQLLRCLLQHADGNCLPIDPVDGPVLCQLSGDQKLQFLDPLRVVGISGSQKDILREHTGLQQSPHFLPGEGKTNLDDPFLLRIPKQRPVEPSAQGNPHGTDDHGFTCSRFSGKHI